MLSAKFFRLRLHLSDISLLFFLAFSIVAISSTAQSDLEDQLYFWEEVDNNSSYNFNKSTIEFKGDSVVIIDYPNDPAGRLKYSSGKYIYNEDSTMVKCRITRSLSFSLNTLFVSYYSLDCNNSIELSIRADSSLVNKIELKPQYLIKDIDRPKKYIVLEYALQETPKRLIPAKWYSNFENYNKKKRLQPCR